MQDYDTPWLEADPIEEAPIVVSRTFRYRDPNGNVIWRDIATDSKLEQNGIFIGTTAEHEDFVRATDIKIPYRPVRDFKEMMDIKEDERKSDEIVSSIKSILTANELYKKSVITYLDKIIKLSETNLINLNLLDRGIRSTLLKKGDKYI